MLTAHELARRLLAGPDHPVSLTVRTPGDAIWSAPGDDVTIQTTESGDISLEAIAAIEDLSDDDLSE